MAKSVRLTHKSIRRIVRALLLETGRHETQMIWQTLHNFGAHVTRPGTAMLGRNRYLGSVVRPACSGISMFGVITHSQGGRTP